MGGPERQTTPRTGLDDFVAGLLRYGTLGYLPPNVLSQLFPPVPGTPGQPPARPGNPVFPPGGYQPPHTDELSTLVSMLTGGGAPGGPSIQPAIQPPYAEPAGGQPAYDQPAPNQPPGYPPSQPGFPPNYPPVIPGVPGGVPAPGNTPPPGSVPFDIGQFIQGRLSVPQYGGPFTAPANPLQTMAAGGVGQSLASFFNPASQTGAGAGSQILQSLLNRGNQSSQTPERSILDMLGAIGPQADLNSAFSALDTQRRTGLGKDIRDLREQFSFSGNRFGSDLANAIATRQTDSENNFLAQTAPLAANLAPQLFGQRVSALGTAGQLGQGAGDQSLQALLGLPGAYSTTSAVPGQVANQGFNIGEQLRQILQGDIGAKQAEFTRTQGGLFPTLLQYAAGAPNIYTPGIGQQLLGAGTTVGASALGAK